MAEAQPGVLAPPPPHARFLSFQLVPGADPREALHAIASAQHLEGLVGIGQPLVAALGATVPGLRPFPALAGVGVAVPSTQAAALVRLHADDRGDLVHGTRAMAGATAGLLALVDVVDAFVYADSRDLTGYEDGTENPEGDAALAAALVREGGPGLVGGSFVAVQQWVHELDAFEAMEPEEQDHAFGRRRSDNEELDDAPASAHVKRTAQESFSPPAFVVRRSMPWADAEAEGLVFVAFGNSLDHYERLLRRMCGLDDGVVDALFGFSRPLTGAYYWCPPLHRGELDLRPLLS